MKVLSSKREVSITIDLQLTDVELYSLLHLTESGFAGGNVVSADLRVALRSAAKDLKALTP